MRERPGIRVGFTYIHNCSPSQEAGIERRPQLPLDRPCPTATVVSSFKQNEHALQLS